MRGVSLGFRPVADRRTARCSEVQAVNGDTMPAALLGAASHDSLILSNPIFYSVLLVQEAQPLRPFVVERILQRRLTRGS